MKIIAYELFLFLVSLLICTNTAAQTKPFSFVAVGDLPYGDTRRVENRYRNLIQLINSISPVFSIHVGDFKAGSTECSDQVFQKQFDYFKLFDQALIYTPGDNDWTDCHRFPGLFSDPIERLDALRHRFFSNKESLGKKPLSVDRQSLSSVQYSAYSENQRWIYEGVLFVTLHIVGSNNNYDPKRKNPKNYAEFSARDDANVAWIRSAFQLAEENNLKAIIFAFQADVFNEKRLNELFPASSGFRKSIGENLLVLAEKSKLPILIIHGDSHEFEFDQPFFNDQQRIENVTRLEVPGGQDVRAVEVTVDIKSASPFRAKRIGEVGGNSNPH